MDFLDTFNELKKIMQPFSSNLVCVSDKEGDYHLDADFLMKNKKPLFFGAVKINKSYVSYHLMPVYVNPLLLEGVSGELKKRMQGKSCFNFKVYDQAIFEELATLTRKSFQYYLDENYINLV